MAVKARTVFVTVGTTKFDDLIRAVDTPEFVSAVKAKGYSKLVIQKGNGEHVPAIASAPPSGLQVECFEYTSSLAQHIASAALVISHAGSGSIFETLTAGTPLIVVPNPKLMDNHQAELGDQLAGMGHLVCAAPAQLAAALSAFDEATLKPYPRGGGATSIAAAIGEFMGVGGKAC